jgi:hypothetical protein
MYGVSPNRDRPAMLANTGNTPASSTTAVILALVEE